MPNFSRRPARPNYTGRRPERRSSSGGNRKRYINPLKFTNRAVTASEEQPYEAQHVFDDFAFTAPLARNIAAKGYTVPSPIQDQAIPHILERRDVIGLANTGTGKTAAFLLPIIQHLGTNGPRPSVLVIAPTRELAQQIEQEFRIFSQSMQLYSTLVVGGMNVSRQIRELHRRPHVVIGTPGRLKDLIGQGHLILRDIDTLVLDEADRMLDMGFLPDIKHIVGSLPRERQTLFFSATITPQIELIVRDFLNDPITISVRTSETSDHVEQNVIETRDKAHKVEILSDLLTKEEYDKVLVFGETKFGVQRLSDTLTRAGIPSAAIHGNKSQSQRQRALQDFKENRVKVLIATDVAARGLDIPNVSHVINFDTPTTYEDYIHRIGRTGRAGAKGTAHTFIEVQHQRY